MTIALVAHDSKKELMAQFCAAYYGILSEHNLCATRITGKVVAEAAALSPRCYLSGSQGGGQQLASSISCNDIDVVFFFRDPMSVKFGNASDSAILKACDMHNIPVATNIATGEALILALQRGDLDWRKGSANISF